ncbi:MAG: glycosyltransferase [Opitutae bacterium]|nr:glycosyltransferase [Opitutae bacterium]
MNICFISGPYKPDKCGISDYISLLSAKLKNHGHQSQHIAIDHGNTLTDIAGNLPPADLYSIQFAPFSFSQTGLSKKRLLGLANSLNGKNTHINFHEIWIGAYPSSKWKEKIIGWLQKREIVKFINISNPVTISCSNSAAIDRLKKSGVDCKYLYLFGNIPYSKTKQRKISTVLTVAFFGTLYEKFPYDLLAEKLDEISKSLNIPIHIKIIGRQREGSGLKEINKICKKLSFVISELGEQPSKAISKEFQNCDLGVSTTPYDILGKSGTTAAMLEHGLPVLSYDDGDTPKDKLFIMQEYREQVFLINDSSATQKQFSFLKKPRKTFFDGVAYTAKKMLEDCFES